MHGRNYHTHQWRSLAVPQSMWYRGGMHAAGKHMFLCPNFVPQLLAMHAKRNPQGIVATVTSRSVKSKIDQPPPPKN